ncbi:hypothetical protein ACHAQJ_009511 [Trichoderma viride]
MVLIKRYGQLPSTANKKAIKSYTLAIPKAELTRMNTLVELSNIASANYENTNGAKEKEHGITREWLVAAKERWQNKFVWQEREQLVNSFPNFKAAIPTPNEDGSPSETAIDIHFTALFSKKKDAVAVLFVHGWPGSFFEFLPILRLLREKYPDEDSLPYHIIVPSLPGYGLSDAPPSNQDFTVTAASQMLDHLMTKVLGITSYITQGGDVGSFVARMNGFNSPSCKGVLLNFSPVPPPPGASLESIDEEDKIAMKRYQWFGTTATAYMAMHATRPSTVGLAIMTNPLAVLAWIGEKFLDWSDPASFPHTSHGDTVSYSVELMDEVIAGASLYYLTGCMATSLYCYRQFFPQGRDEASSVQRDLYIAKPKIFGYSFFPWEVMGSPKEWIATSGDMVFFKRHPRGGHFAALEQPAAVLGDVEEFLKLLPAEL